jgi:hypothetical protein
MPTFVTDEGRRQIKEITTRVAVPSVKWITLLGCVLVVLKVLHKIDLPWWQVLLPFYWWLAALIGIGILVLAFICIAWLCCMIYDSINGYFRHQRWLKQEKKRIESRTENRGSRF